METINCQEMALLVAAAIKGDEQASGKITAFCNGDKSLEVAVVDETINVRICFREKEGEAQRTAGTSLEDKRTADIIRRHGRGDILTGVKIISIL